MGAKYLPLSVVQNAARLLTNVDRSALSVRRLSHSECQLMNDLCNSAGLNFVVDSTTDVVDVLTVCGMAHRTPIVRFLPSEDPFGCAQFIDVPEDVEQQSNATDSTVAQPSNRLYLPLSHSVAYPTSNDLKIVDVRGSMKTVHSRELFKTTSVFDQLPVSSESSSGIGQLVGLRLSLIFRLK
jgi:hypothetical protein